MVKQKLLCAAVALALIQVGALRLSAQGPNGTAPRPFYVIGHNPNTTVDALFAIMAGANALEPDLMVLPDGAVDLLGNPDPKGIVVYHDCCTLLTSRVPQTLVEYLDGIHLLAKQFPQLALIMFDIKHEAATCENGLFIQSMVNTHLNIDGVNLNIIYNVGPKEDRVAFRDLANNCNGIIGQLGEREAVQIDDNNNPDQMVALLKDATNGNITYGDGTLGIGPNLPRALDHASFLRASWGFPRWSYVFTIDLESTMNFFIDAGVDGIIPDWTDPFHPEFDLIQTPPHIAKLKALVGPPLHPEIRMATREDNPFKPELQAYGLRVNTMNTNGGGTDADLTFTLKGCEGQAAVTVNTGLVHVGYASGRMEANQPDWVTIPSLNLGKLASLEIFNDGTGPFPPWDLADVRISSARWLGPDFTGIPEYTATFNDTIHGGDTKKLDLAANFPEPEPTIECPASITVDNAPGKCNAVVTFAPKADGMCPSDLTATSVPPSGTTFAVGTTNVKSTASSPNFFPNSHPMCSFNVTVKDVELPALTCPAPMTIDATGPQGATAFFAPAASDNCSATVTSIPASGSLFAIGTTNVNSTAQDPSGNQSSCSFTVHVKGAAEQLGDLIGAVTNLSAKDGTKTALLAKLEAALASVQSSNTLSACGTLASFILDVEAKSGKDISVVDATALIAKATQIRTVLGC